MMRVICTEQDTEASEEEGEAAMEGVGAWWALEGEHSSTLVFLHSSTLAL